MTSGYILEKKQDKCRVIIIELKGHGGTSVI